MWFHCGRCGALFQAPAGPADGRLCSVCGADPCSSLESVETPATKPAGDHEPENPPAGLLPRHGRRTKRRRKNRHIMLKLMLGWLVVLAMIIFGARKLWHRETPSSVHAVVSADGNAPPVLNSEDLLLLQQAGTACGAVFEGFLKAGTPEARNQFVLSPVATASRMARFHSLNPVLMLDAGKLKPDGSGLLHLPDGTKAFEAIWKVDDGRLFDVSFRRENDEWRMDWDHFVRYSDYPWALFLAGSGPDEGEFRLLARERLAEERKAADTISLVLYAPRFGNPHETGIQSPEFLIPRASQDGRLLDAAFAQARSGGRLYGSSLPRLDPDGMIRVRVKVRRGEAELERKFEIARVIACHWFTMDDPGVQLTPVSPGAETGATPRAQKN
jgi:hypothetical protein